MPSLPLQFLNSLKGLDHLDLKAFEAIHLSGEQISSLRLNPFKPVELDFTLGSQVPWNSLGYYLNERPSYTYDPLFHSGCYYVQEAGSMFLEFALKQCVDFTKAIQVLDVCAAPGGKSTLISSLLNDESMLIANELNASRSSTLAYNLSKWGRANCLVTNNDPQRFSKVEQLFDVLVIDAPCSGSGLFRKQADAIDEWSVENVNHCSKRQKDILREVLPCLKEDGLLFYSTCSYSTEENESIVEWLMTEHEMELIDLPIENTWGIVANGLGYRFYPHLLKSEGFFCSLLRKKSEGIRHLKTKVKKELEVGTTERKTLEDFLSGHDYHILKKNNRFHLMNEKTRSFFTEHEKHFYFKKAGIALGEIKGKDMVPDHELSLSCYTNPKFRRVELELDMAIKFLKKENFLLPEEAPGLCLFTYKNQGLGWAKILPQRINNYLPSELRILK